jgi:predicted nucleic acid-binding protein
VRLVLDTNILIAALARDSVTRELLCRPGIECLVPDIVFSEIEAHRRELLRKSGLSAAAFDTVLSGLKSRLVPVPASRILHRTLAWRIMAAIDVKDAPFIALALSFDCDGIWSQDRHFERQRVVRVWKTEDILRWFDYDMDKLST